MPNGRALSLTWKREPGIGYKGAEARVRAGAVDGLNAIGLVTTNAMKSGIQRGPKTGRTYRKYNPNRTHQASAPGEYPATDTGRLVASIGYDTADPNAVEGSTQLGMIVFANADYALPLELKPSSKGGRPFMSTTIDRLKKGYGMILSKAINARLK